jgi:hypothetical protein
MSEAPYGQVDRVLRGLGFTVRIDKGNEHRPDARVYRHDQSGAVILLPVFQDEAAVLPHHMLTVRWTLDQFGVASPPTFEEQLQKAS